MTFLDILKMAYQMRKGVKEIKSRNDKQNILNTQLKKSLDIFYEQYNKKDKGHWYI